MKAKNELVSRRQMITRVAATAGWLALSSPFAPLFAEETKRRFKIGACQWSLRTSGPECFEGAKEIGLDGVQVDMGTAGNDMRLRKPEVQQAYLAAAKKSGLQISSLAIAEMNNVPLKNDPRAEQWLVAEFAKGDLNGDKAGIDHTVEVLKRLAPKAETAGVIFGLENYLSAGENL